MELAFISWYSHEDEDTLSLENLFPCDQTEVYASKKISFIIDELIQTEVNYVNNLRKGLKNYGNLQDREDLPEGLRGTQRQQLLLCNISEILELHDKEILPLFLRNQRDLKGLFDEFAAYFEVSQGSTLKYLRTTKNNHINHHREQSICWYFGYSLMLEGKQSRRFCMLIIFRVE